MSKVVQTPNLCCSGHWAPFNVLKRLYQRPNSLDEVITTICLIYSCCCPTQSSTFWGPKQKQFLHWLRLQPLQEMFKLCDSEDFTSHNLTVESKLAEVRTRFMLGTYFLVHGPHLQSLVVTAGSQKFTLWIPFAGVNLVGVPLQWLDCVSFPSWQTWICLSVEQDAKLSSDFVKIILFEIFFFKISPVTIQR